MNLKPDEVALLQRAAAHLPLASLDELTPAMLHSTVREHGVDFATSLLYDRFRKSPRHAPFISSMERALGLSHDKCRGARWKVAVVPGALYVERPDLGGDAKIVFDVADQIGLSIERVPLASRGSVTENATLLAEWLKAQSGEKLVLISLSKGGPDLTGALHRPDAAQLFRNVIAWVNICGPLNGSPMADWILASRLRATLLKLQYRLQRRDFAFITELCHESNSTLPSHLPMIPHMRMTSLVGFPLRKHLTTALSRFCHKIIGRLGPNDGTMLLSDAISWPGEIYPVWGADHYMRPEERARGLLHAVFAHLGEVCG